MQVSIIDIYTA